MANGGPALSHYHDATFTTLAGAHASGLQQQEPYKIWLGTLWPHVWAGSSLSLPNLTS